MSEGANVEAYVLRTRTVEVEDSSDAEEGCRGRHAVHDDEVIV